MTKRIQLSRRKGWRMPPNAVKVDRTTIFGNPYPTGPGRDAAASVAAFRDHCRDNPAIREMAIRKLAGRDLACWCKIGSPCHADILLRLARGEDV